MFIKLVPHYHLLKGIKLWNKIKQCGINWLHVCRFDTTCIFLYNYFNGNKIINYNISLHLFTSDKIIKTWIFSCCLCEETDWLMATSCYFGGKHVFDFKWFFAHTCTERGKTWWGSGESRRLSSLWFRWLSGDTAERNQREENESAPPTTNLCWNPQNFILNCR